MAALVAGAAGAQTLRIWGSAQMTELTENWERGFAKAHPQIHFENHMYGAVSAIPGLYTGVADIAISREIWPIEEQAFEQVTGHKVTAFEVATGSFDFPTKSSALHIFVHKDNPFRELTVQQLGRIFGWGGDVLSWKDLGGGADKPIHAYGYKIDNAGAMLFASLVMHGSLQWSCGFQGFGNQALADGKRIDAGQRILDALARDPWGIAISNIHYARPEVKAIAIGGSAPSLKTTQDRSYPLTRSVYVFVNGPIGASVKDFLRYILSMPGQRDVERERAYLPLPSQVLAAQIKLLN